MTASEELKTSMLEEDLVTEDRDDYFKCNKSIKELKKRRHIVRVFFFGMVSMLIFDGLYFARDGNGTTVGIIMFWCSKILQTFAVSGGLIHAYFHKKSRTRYNWYIVASSFWAIVCGLSTLPAMLDYQSIVYDDIAISILHALSAGILLWSSFYFWRVDFEDVSTRCATIRRILFALAFGLTWVCSFFIRQ